MGEFQQFLTDFLPQLPLPLLFVVCGGPLLMIVMLLFFRGQRTRRSKSKDAEILQRPMENDTIPVEVNAEDDHRWMPVEEPFIPQTPDTSPSPVRPEEDELDPLDLLAQARAEAEELGEIPAEEAPAPVSPPPVSPSPTPTPAQPAPSSALHTITSLPIFARLENGSVIRSREILSVLRDQSDQRLMVQLADTAYRSLAEDPDAREQFKRVMKELSGTIMQPDDGESITPDDEPTELHTITLQPMHVRLSNGAVTKAREILSIQRDFGDKRLLVQIGDVAYRSLAEDPDAREEFKRVMKELSGTIMQPDDAPPPAPTVTQEQPLIEPAISAAPAQSTSQIEETVAEDDEEQKPRIPGDLPNLLLDDEPDNYKRTRFGYVRVTKVDKAPEINIADAIEEYLQYKISQLPQFQQRGIHIKPAPSGGVRIQADGNNYEFVDEVTDPDVRQLLQETIAEWQDRQ